jgi:hypothetical protein
MASLWKKAKAAGREKMTPKDLELAITDAVRKSDAQCETFVRVWVEPSEQKMGKDANWTIKGIQFGRADRNKCRSALTDVVKRMQNDYELWSD